MSEILPRMAEFSSQNLWISSGEARLYFKALNLKFISACFLANSSLASAISNCSCSSVDSSSELDEEEDELELELEDSVEELSFDFYSSTGDSVFVSVFSSSMVSSTTAHSIVILNLK